MKKSVLLTAAALTTVLSVSAANAQSPRFGWGHGATDTPYIDATQADQLAKIEQGRRSGQLSGREYRQLLAEQERIRMMERRAKADGVADPYERRRIREAQEVAGRHIYQDTHNGETRWSNWYRRWW